MNDYSFGNYLYTRHCEAENRGSAQIRCPLRYERRAAFREKGGKDREHPFWKHQAIVEIELSDPETEFSLPLFLKLIREVSDDPDFKNVALARL